nr:c-type cytochrome [uncultured Roseovarius sp.]
MNKFIATAAALMLAVPALAENHEAAEMVAPSGDAEAGETLFNRQCIACHVVRDDAGEVLAGRNARNGPNLYGIAGRAIGSQAGFRYGKSLSAVAETGNLWDEAEFVTYVQDPTGWLRETLDDSKARSKMAFKVRKQEEATDIYAFLYALKPPAMDDKAE